MKPNQKGEQQRKDGAAYGASRQSGLPGSASTARGDSQSGTIDRKEESRRSRSDDARSEVSRSHSRSGARNR